MCNKKDQDLSALKVDLVEPAGDLVGRLKVSLNVHPVMLQRDLTHLDNCYGEDDDDNGGNGDEDDVCNEMNSIKMSS